MLNAIKKYLERLPLRSLSLFVISDLTANSVQPHNKTDYPKIVRKKYL